MRDVYLFLMGHCRDRNFSLASISFIFPASILFSRLSKRHESSRSFVGRTLVHVTKTAAIKKKEKERKNYGRWWKGQTARDFAPRTISMKKAGGWSFSSSVFFFYSCVFELKASHKIHTHTHTTGRNYRWVMRHDYEKQRHLASLYA